MYLLLLVFGGLLGAAGVVLVVSGLSLRDGAFDTAILTPGIVAAAGGLLLIGLAAGLRTLQQIQRILASRPVARELPIAEAAKATPEASREPVRLPFAPKLPHEHQAGTAAREVADDRPAAEVAGKVSLPLGAIPSAAVAEAGVDAVPRPSKNGNGATGAGTGVRLPVSLRRVTPGERAGEPTLDAIWPKGARPTRAVEAPSGAVVPGSIGQPSRFDTGPTGANRDAVPAASAGSQDGASISVLKSGVVNGMPYTLYSDGSIEAQLAEGTLRFGSITELRNHIEQSA